MSGSQATAPREAWGSRIGLILAMAGNAVGLGNFLRFPVQAAANGGGSFLVPYFVAFLLLGLPLVWIEWGVGRNVGRYGRSHVPAMFAVLWRHPLAKYLGVVGLFMPLVVFIYYAYVMSWTLAFTLFSLTSDYWGNTTQEAMAGYLRAYQGVGVEGPAGFWTPFLFFAATLSISVLIVSRGIAGGVERLAKVAMPVLFLFAVVLAVVVLTLPAGPGGETALAGLEFIYRPDLSRLDEPGVWLAAAGQMFFTLSVGMGTLNVYASYLSTRDDVVLSGVATAATNETAEVVLGGTIAIPAAVVFFGVSGAVAVAQSGAFNLGFTTMPVVFQQLPLGQLLGALWFGLLFFAGLTSSVAHATPLIAFFREEFGVTRERVAWSLWAVALGFGAMHVLWLEHGFLDEWDFWAGTLGLVVFAVVETVLFMWVFRPENAWRSIHQGADLRLPRVFKWVMTWVTPMYLLVLLTWWAAADALPILRMERAAGGGAVSPEAEPFVLLARGILLALLVGLLMLIRLAWKRNAYSGKPHFGTAPEPFAAATSTPAVEVSA